MTADDNSPGIYWCGLEADLFVIVACMPSIHAVLSRMWRGLNGSDNDTTTTDAKAYYDRSNKNSYFNRLTKTPENYSGITSNRSFGGITRSTEVNVYHTKRSDASSDVELLDRPPYLKDFEQRRT